MHHFRDTDWKFYDSYFREQVGCNSLFAWSSNITTALVF